MEEKEYNNTISVKEKICFDNNEKEMPSVKPELISSSFKTIEHSFLDCHLIIKDFWKNKYQLNRNVEEEDWQDDYT